MLQTFRDNLKGTVAFFLIGIIVVIFALTGVDALFVSNSKAGLVASVNGAKISENELRRSIFTRKQQLMGRFGDQLPAQFLSDETLRQPVLNDLIQREVLRQYALDHGLAVSDATLNQMIVETPQFQQDGKYSPQLLSQLLQNMGYTPMGYRKELASDVILNQLSQGLISSAFVTDLELDQLLLLTHQTRDFYYLTLPLAKELASVEVSDEEVESYFAAHETEFQSKEQVQVSYLDVDVDDLMARTTVSEAEIKEQYQQEMANFKPVTQRRVAHILVESADTDTIDKVTQKLAAGESFETLAKSFSVDPVSSNQGGDLGFTDGTVFPESFEAALAKLTLGRVSTPVVTDAGTHFIKLLELVESEPSALEQEKPRIQEAIARAKAENHFVEILQSLADLTFNADDLQYAADELGLTLNVSEMITREGGNGIFTDPKVTSAVFSDEVLKNGHNSEVIELSQSHVAVVRVKDYQPSRQLTLDEVRDQVVVAVQLDRAHQVLLSRAQAFIDQIKNGSTVENIAKEHGLEWQVELGATRFDAKADRNIVDFIFALPNPQNGMVVQQTEMANGDVVIASLTNVKAGEVTDAEERSMIRKRYLQQEGNVENALLSEELLRLADVKTY